MFKQFTNDKHYLHRYYSKSIAILLAAILMLAVIAPSPLQDVLLYLPAILMLSSSSIQIALVGFIYAAIIGLTCFDCTLISLGWVPLALIATFPLSALFHNACHNNIRPRWFGRLAGEAIGAWQLSGVPEWAIVHMLHHANSDDPALDPHPPLNKGYWAFLVNMRNTVRIVFARHYLHLWGNNAESLGLLRNLSLLMRFGTILKVLFWFLLLGPELFSFLFAFSIPFKMCHYAWFNYATHRPDGDGAVITNRNEHVYKLINAFAFGLYFHRNHHIRPSLFDPRNHVDKKYVQSSNCSPTLVATSVMLGHHEAP